MHFSTRQCERDLSVVTTHERHDQVRVARYSVLLRHASGGERLDSSNAMLGGSVRSHEVLGMGPHETPAVLFEIMVWRGEQAEEIGFEFVDTSALLGRESLDRMLAGRLRFPDSARMR